MKNSLLKKLLSAVICVALMVGYLPAVILAADGDTLTRVADPSTMDSWQEFFLQEQLSTENAGGVWVDKSVFTDDTAFNGTGITQKDPESFLVALSAIGANMTVTGMNSVPTDTMLVLDVSGSMNDNVTQSGANNDVAQELVEAANESIHTLLTANKYNRVGVVLYSGPLTRGGATSDNDAVLMLPLGRYTPGTSGEYLNYIYVEHKNKQNQVESTDESVQIDPELIFEKASPNDASVKPTQLEKDFLGGTYIQKGLMLAANQFTSASNQTTVVDPAMGTLNRKPVVVLMSDGSPTVASTDFKDPDAIDIGDGMYTSASMGFVNQLTASYAKGLIEEKYKTKALFYTLGLAVGDDSVAVSVLDPDNTSGAINGLWTIWNRTVTGRYANIGAGNTNTYIRKTNDAVNKTYVDGYFSVDKSGNMAQGLKDAFADIVGTIQLQSRYFPTLISQSEELSGYVTFVDRVGEYMHVADVKGVLIHDTLFSGADLASNCIEGGKFGSVQEPSALGTEMVNAVKVRLGLDSEETARTLIGLAYKNGQLYYNEQTGEYSNYIGWYANAAGEFLGFYHEGLTVLPEATGDTATDPAFTVKSFGYLGEVDKTQGVSESDMMYATVQVRRNLATDEELVTFAIPAALLPIVTYNVTLDETGALKELTASGAQQPIRLVYEVALDEGINSFNVKEKVSAEYLADPHNVNTDGSVNFYSNQWEHENISGYGTVNTYAYFNPSRQNDKYYYTENAPVYADAEGTLYEGTAQPSGEKYRAIKVYKETLTGYKTEIIYRRLSDAALGTAVKIEGTSNWEILAGNVHVNLEGYTITKSANETQTLTDANVPFVDTKFHSVGDTGYNFFVGASLGNNGKLSLSPETGIKLTKALANGASTDIAFEFTVENTSDSKYSAECPAMLIAADGTESLSTVSFTAGKAKVSIKAGETLYIGGMTPDDVIKVTETETADYFVQAVNIEGTAAQATEATLTVAQGQTPEIEFVNAARGKGDFILEKKVEHDFGTAYKIPADKIFEIKVTLSGIGTANATFEAAQTNSAITSVTTDINGEFTVSLKHSEQLRIKGLPEGTSVTATETDPGTGFTPIYWDNGILGDGAVDIAGNSTASVIVVNDYAPAFVYPVNITVEGSKTLLGRDWLESDSFTFVLEKQIGQDIWQTLGTAVANMSNKTFSFTNAFANEKYTEAGEYYYRVVELEPSTGAVVGVSYDKTVHSFAVKVEDTDMDGQLEISSVTSSRPGTTAVTQPTENSWKVNTSFTNSYTTTGEATVTVDINKKVVNQAESPNSILKGFTFALYNSDGSVAFTSEPTTERGFSRLVLTYSKAGVYSYTLKEIVPAMIPAGWSYSNSEIPVTVTVTENTEIGKFEAVIALGSNSATGNSVSAEFVNTYAPKSARLAIDFVNKELSGRALEANEFGFELQTREGTKVLSGTNNADGSVSFNGTLEFDKVGTYFYNIVELESGKLGVADDKNTYFVTVNVTDENGELKAVYVIDNSDEREIVFKNTYTPEPVSVTLGGTKVLEGKTLLNDEFSFIFAQALDAEGKQLVEGSEKEVYNFQNGSFSFPSISYSEAGTYYYVISEREGSGVDYGIVYDGRAYIATVTVTDNTALGKLEADVSYKLVGESGEAELKFVNKYIPDAASAAVSGIKTLSGKALNGDDFEFELYASDSQWKLGEKLDSVKNDVNGDFEFLLTDYTNNNSLSFDRAGSYYYLVKEVGGGTTVEGVIYDPTVYRVRLEVSDNKLGKLISELYVFDQDDIPCENLLFLNEYKVSGSATVVLPGSKELKNGEIEDNKFSFELYQADEGFNITEEQPIQTAWNKGNSFEFKLEYTPEQLEIGTFFYVAKELNGGSVIDRITYDSSEYFITVKLEDNGVGGIDASYSISKGGETVESLAFVNTFTPKPEDISVEIDVLKTVDNKGSEALSPENFEFVLENTENGNKLFELSDENGKAKFTLSYTEDDAGKTFSYKLSETAGDVENVTYDATVYEITVAIGLDENNKLVATLKNNGKEASKLAAEFVNIYDYTPEPPNPPSYNTGDSENRIFWILALIASACGIFAVATKFKKKENAEF